MVYAFALGFCVFFVILFIQVLHIDFGDCFEVATKRDKFPEKIPFRLTRMLIKVRSLVC